ncbi:chemotaxis protein CheB [Gemmatimonas sp.]|jgi:two-component system CheB/CheR fusion protein|uniref:chemotaxis protein CheB n=1 Tax=Gemmatimonas sp. TaxID=1962908 RepID=UPI0022C7EEAC|nr:chemotaxis protein CheB [Gemmatimonas sp.]MCA2985552.1 PAS domain-containing protein [Gemmatimonas sp.]MCA2987554.1 PAS domain-containing protein [Gemmatimonas sp.]MCA2995913.1 PAS domain-containing protein [Gemmatimonas sp.]MCE2954586.1 PAS domain-containing protein [Gemmatimonas sp.]MCZ8012377.1 PAS domain-containing protein [Gemmatimonas sp.]
MTSPEQVSGAKDAPSFADPQMLAVCAIGASAGGLEALQQFFDNADPNRGISYVVVQHLSPDHKSLMVELLRRHTTLKVVRAQDGMRIEPDTVYLNPPKTNLTIEGGVLRMAEQPVGHGLHLPIDVFFASLALAMGEHAVGVVLSGTGSDGTRGARELKAEGGLVLVQDPTEAQFDGMPRSVVATGLADQVLPVADIPGTVAQFFLRRGGGRAFSSSEQGAGTASQVQRVLGLLRDRLGTDFTGYKPNTIVRRIERRVLMHPGLGWDDYVRLLEDSKPELVQLHRDLLINVTRFFRDEEAFRLLEQRVIPQLVQDTPPDSELRVWVPACSTGEEPYSIVILILEALEREKLSRNVRVFATDVDQDAVEFAAAGRYGDSIAADMTPERLSRWFVADGDGYKVSRALRDRVIFARHNLLKDPPLTRMDFVSCRNMLIYLGTDLQRRVIALLAYALRARGYLFLGSSETVGTLSTLFDVVDQKWKLFQALQPGRHTLAEALPTRPRRPLMQSFSATTAAEQAVLATRSGAPRTATEDGLLERVFQELTDVLKLRCVVLDAEYQLLHTFGDVSSLLKVPAGRSTLEIFKLLPRPLSAALRAALGRVAKEHREILYEGIEVAPDEPTVRMHVRPLDVGPDRARAYVIFFESGPKPLAGGIADRFAVDDSSALRLSQLEHELQYTKENLQATIEELETSNEELQATNEELLASNEELQSTNEELQSVNEELQTVNAEYQEKIAELISLNNDIENLLRTTGVGTLFVDASLRIRKFTDAALRLLNVMPQDIGRPLDHIAAKIPGVDLVAMCRRVMNADGPESHEVQAPDGSHLHVKVLPYLTGETGVHGVIVSVIDVTEVKRGEERLQHILDSIPSSIAVLGPDGTIVQTNAEWARFAKVNEAPPALVSGIGLNYVATCMAATDDAMAHAVGRGLREVLGGKRERFELQYPCHSPDKRRFFLLQATALTATAPRGALVQHFDISSQALRLEQLTQWVAQVQALQLDGVPTLPDA